MLIQHEKEAVYGKKKMKVKIYNALLIFPFNTENNVNRTINIINRLTV